MDHATLLQALEKKTNSGNRCQAYDARGLMGLVDAQHHQGNDDDDDERAHDVSLPHAAHLWTLHMDLLEDHVMQHVLEAWGRMYDRYFKTTKDERTITGMTDERKDERTITGMTDERRDERTITGMTDERKATGMTDERKDERTITGMTDERNVTGMTDERNVTGNKDERKATGTKEERKATGNKEERGMAGMTDAKTITTSLQWYETFLAWTAACLRHSLSFDVQALQRAVTQEPPALLHHLYDVLLWEVVALDGVSSPDSEQHRQYALKMHLFIALMRIEASHDNILYGREDALGRLFSQILLHQLHIVVNPTHDSISSTSSPTEARTFQAFGKAMEMVYLNISPLRLGLVQSTLPTTLSTTRRLLQHHLNDDSGARTGSEHDPVVPLLGIMTQLFGVYQTLQRVDLPSTTTDMSSFYGAEEGAEVFACLCATWAHLTQSQGVWDVSAPYNLLSLLYPAPALLGTSHATEILAQRRRLARDLSVMLLRRLKGLPSAPLMQGDASPRTCRHDEQVLVGGLMLLSRVTCPTPSTLFDAYPLLSSSVPIGAPMARYIHVLGRVPINARRGSIRLSDAAIPAVIDALRTLFEWTLWRCQEPDARGTCLTCVDWDTLFSLLKRLLMHPPRAATTSVVVLLRPLEQLLAIHEGDLTWHPEGLYDVLMLYHEGLSDTVIDPSPWILQPFTLRWLFRHRLTIFYATTTPMAGHLMPRALLTHLLVPFYLLVRAPEVAAWVAETLLHRLLLDIQWDVTVLDATAASASRGSEVQAMEGDIVGQVVLPFFLVPLLRPVEGDTVRRRLVPHVPERCFDACRAWHTMDFSLALRRQALYHTLDLLCLYRGPAYEDLLRLLFSLLVGQGVGMDRAAHVTTWRHLAQACLGTADPAPAATGAVGGLARVLISLFQRPFKEDPSRFARVFGMWMGCLQDSFSAMQQRGHDTHVMRTRRDVHATLLRCVLDIRARSRSHRLYLFPLDRSGSPPMTGYSTTSKATHSTYVYAVEAGHASMGCAAFPLEVYIDGVLALLKKHMVVMDLPSLLLLLSGLQQQLLNQPLFAAVLPATMYRFLAFFCEAIVNDAWGNMGMFSSRTMSEGADFVDDIDMTYFPKSSSSSVAYRDELRWSLAAVLTSFIHYARSFTKSQQDGIVFAFDRALHQWSPRVAPPCLHGIRLCCHVAPRSITKFLPSLIQRLSRISSSTGNASLAIKVLSFLSSLARAPKLHSNFVETDFKLIFGIATRYVNAIYHDLRVETKRRPSAAASPSITNSKDKWLQATSQQFILSLSYQVIALWFLRLRPLERRGYVQFAVHSLLAPWRDHLQEVEGMGHEDFQHQNLDMPEYTLNHTWHNHGHTPWLQLFHANTNVLLDQLLRYAFSPRPEDTVHCSSIESTVASMSKPIPPPGHQILLTASPLVRSWVVGYAIVTVHANPTGDWSWVVVRRPAGISSWLTQRCDLAAGISSCPLLNEEQSLVSGDDLENLPLSNFEKLSLSIDSNEGNGQNDLAIQEKIENFIDGVAKEELDSLPEVDVPSDHESSHTTTAADPCSFLHSQFSAYPFHMDGDACIPVTSSSYMSQEEFRRATDVLDRTPVVDLHKIGIVYVGEVAADTEMHSETDILSHSHGSFRYMQFLRNLGTWVRLRGCRQVYTGGLDTHEDLDGKYTIYWKDEVAQTVFHVATLMPSDDCEGRMSRAMCNAKKRHIGNDFVNIVYNDSHLPFKFSTLPSQLLTFQIVLRPLVDSSTNDPLCRDEMIAPGIELQSPVFDDESPLIFEIIVQQSSDFTNYQTSSSEKHTLSTQDIVPQHPMYISEVAMPKFVRLLALHLNLYAMVYWQVRSGPEYITPWRERLRQIQKIREKLSSSKISKNNNEKSYKSNNVSSSLGRPFVMGAKYRHGSHESGSMPNGHHFRREHEEKEGKWIKDTSSPETWLDFSRFY